MVIIFDFDFTLLTNTINWQSTNIAELKAKQKLAKCEMTGQFGKCPVTYNSSADYLRYVHV